MLTLFLICWSVAFYVLIVFDYWSRLMFPLPNKVKLETRPATFARDSTYRSRRNDHSFHWLISERSSQPAICEWMNGAGHCVNETKPVSPEEMYKRGWSWHSQVTVPKDIKGDTLDSSEYLWGGEAES